MRSLLLFFIMIMLLSSCSKENDVGIKSCIFLHQDSSLIHPKNQLYTYLLNTERIKGFPGLALAVLDSANGLWIGTSGYASIESKAPLEKCHLHHSASV